MPNISLLDPLVLNGVVQKLTADENLTLLPKVHSVPSSAPNYTTWDVIKGGHQLAGFALPGEEAVMMNQLGRTQESSVLAYTRIKKTFQPQLIHWLREPGQIAATNAEKYVMREIQDMNQAVDLQQEQLLWQALRGTSQITYRDGSYATVNYQFPSSHLVSPNTPWTTATPTQIVKDIVAWKRLISTHARVPAKTAYASELTIQKIFDSFAANASAVINSGGTQTAAAAMGGMLTDRMKDAYYTNSILPNFGGLDWIPVDAWYTNAAGNITRFVGDGTNNNAEVFIGNYEDNNPWEVRLGKTADDSAPEGMYGKFTKTWKQEDPSARFVLVELHHLPVIERPEQFVFCSNVG